MGTQLQPFRMGTRQRRQFIGTLAYGANSVVTQELPRVGYLARVIVQFRGVATLSGAGALSDLGPFAIAQRFRLNTNIGAASIVDVSGYGAHLAHRLQQEAGDLQQAGIGQTVPSADIYTVPVAMGANTWAMSWILPVAANVGREFEFGLINLQSPETRVTLDIVTGALTDAAALITGITGSWYIWVEYYEVPDPRVFAQPPLTLVRLLEEQVPIGQVGDNIYTFPRMGVLMQTINYVRVNGLRSDLFDAFQLRFNKTDTVYRQDRQLARILERFQTICNPITGVFELDLWQATGAIGEGDGRDNVDLEELSTVEQILTVNAGAGLGANNNFYNVVRRIAQRLQ